MPKYFFDIYNSDTTLDDHGHDLPNDEAVREMTMRSLPMIAADEIPHDGDHRNFVVVARDENGTPVYSATLSYVGLWLNKR